MIRFFKEIFTFIRLLFTKIDKSDLDLEPWGIKYILSSGYKYMCWCGKVLYHEDKPEEGNLNDEDRNHETIHLVQAFDKGSWIKYYWSCLIEWLKGGIFTKKGYCTNKNEVEAYAKEGDLDYLSRRPKDNVEKFKLEDRSTIWKECGKNSYRFKQYIKEKYKDI